MDYNGNQSGNGNSENVQQDWGQQNASQKPVVVNELVLGILGIVFCWVICVPIILCVIGLVMGIVSIIRTDQHRGLSAAGIVTSAIGLVLSILLHLLYILLS